MSQQPGLISAIKNRVVPKGERSTTVRFGLNRGAAFNADLAHDTQQVLGLYEREIFPTISHFTSIAKTCIDVGADAGFFTLYFLRQPNIEKVIALDPVPINITRVTNNIEANELFDPTRVTLVQAFAGTSASEDHVTLDSLAPQCTDPIFVKIDVEGMELEVLKGATSLLSSHDTYWLIETHSQDLELACIDLVTSCGYETQVIRNARYRAVIPENRVIPHNRWLAVKPRS